MRYLFIAILLLAGCTHKHKAQDTQNPTDRLWEKHEKYIAWSNDRVNQSGFDIDDPCDSIQRTCLRFVGGANPNYREAQNPNEPGRWYRDSARSCGPASGTSDSGFSRDMAVALGLCFWQAADVDNAKAFMTYVGAHQGRMAPDGPYATTDIGLVLPHLFRAIIAKAGNTPLPPKPAEIDIHTQRLRWKGVPDLTGFRAHIAMLGVVLSGSLYGGLNALEMEFVKRQAGRQSQNALYQAVFHKYTDGDQTDAITILTNPSLFPDDNLPTSVERDDSYLWEHDQEDWSPELDKPAKTWTGTDFLFASAIVLGQLRGD